MPDPSRCALCGEPAEQPELIALCPEHVALAALVHGAEDALPSPCLLCGARLGTRYPSGWLCSVCEWPHGQRPDAELPPPRVDVVYYLRLDARVKIGTTANPRQRFAALPHEQLLALERGGRSLERRRHREFAEHRLGTSEWFDLAPPIQELADVLARGVDPWDRWYRWVAEATAAL